ncbi:MAG: hypothetical protein V4577_25885 [Bacteroidota bacterium]
MQTEDKRFYRFLAEFGKDIYTEAFEHVFLKAKGLFENDFELFKIFWNYEEKNIPVFSFKSAVSWLKDNYRPEGNYKGGVYCIPRNQKGIIELHIFFLQDGKPVLNGSVPHLVVNTQEIADDLKKMLDNKNLLIIQ